MFEIKSSAILILLVLAACSDKPSNTKQKKNTNAMQKEVNPVVYFEIPVTDLNRAIDFYSAVFNLSFTKQTIDNNEMALFPSSEGEFGISGALAKGESYKPSKEGVVIYFTTANIDSTLALAIKNGGQTLYPKTSIGELGFVAEFQDSEGNRIALHQSNTKNKK